MREQEVWLDAQVQCFVLCGHAGAADPAWAVLGKEEKQAQLGAALLHKLLEDPASTRPLAAKGLHKFRPDNPVPLPAAITLAGGFGGRIPLVRADPALYIWIVAGWKAALRHD